MASTYKVGTISEILAKECGNSHSQKTDPKLAALFSNGSASFSSPTSKVFRTLKVDENLLFKKKANAVSSDVAVNGITAKRAAKKKADKYKLNDNVSLKHKDAAEIRVAAKKKVKIGLNSETKVDNSSVKVKKEKKKKLKKKKLRDVKQNGTVTSSGTSAEEVGSPSTLPPAPRQSDASNSKKEKKLKKKNKKRKLGADGTEDKPEPIKNIKLGKDGINKKKQKKQKKGKKGGVVKQGDNETDNVKVEIKEEDESDDEHEIGDSATAEKSIAQSAKNSSNVVKTLAEKNAPKAKDPELEARTLFVGNLPGDIQKKMLKKLFKKYGKIETVRLRGGSPNKPTQLKKVAVNKKELHADKNTLTGYIRFATREEAENAAQKGRGLIIQENHIVLDLAEKGEGEKRDNKKAIFVGNLNLKITDEELWRFFEDCGTIISVRVIRDNATGLGKGFGYVNFDEKEAVVKALQKNQQELRKRSVRISRCVKKLKVKKDVGTKKTVTGKPYMGNRESGKSTRGKTTKSPKDANDYSGDKLAEIGKLKRKSNKPNRGELYKAKIVRLLGTNTGKPSPMKTPASPKPINSRQSSKNPQGTKWKRYFN